MEPLDLKRAGGLLLVGFLVRWVAKGAFDARRRDLASLPFMLGARLMVEAHSPVVCIWVECCACG